MDVSEKSAAQEESVAAKPKQEGLGLMSLLRTMEGIRSGDSNSFLGDALKGEAGNKLQEIVNAFKKAFTEGDFGQLTALFDSKKTNATQGKAVNEAKDVHVSYTRPEQGAGRPVVNTDAPLDPNAKIVELVTPDGKKSSLEEGFNKEVDAQGSKRIETPIKELAANNAALEQESLSQNKPAEESYNAPNIGYGGA